MQAGNKLQPKHLNFYNQYDTVLNVLIEELSIDSLEKCFKETFCSSPSSVSRQPRCSKHRWLWQFMKELLLVGDSALQVLGYVGEWDLITGFIFICSL